MVFLISYPPPPLNRCQSSMDVYMHSCVLSLSPLLLSIHHGHSYLEERLYTKERRNQIVFENESMARFFFDSFTSRRMPREDEISN